MNVLGGGGFDVADIDLSVLFCHAKTNDCLWPKSSGPVLAFAIVFSQHLMNVIFYNVLDSYRALWHVA